MAGRDDVRVELVSNPLEQLISRLASGVLHGRMERGSARENVRALRPERQARRFCQLTTELLIPGRGIAKAVIEMDDPRDAQLAVDLELAQQPEQRDRIGSAGDGHEHAIATADKGLAP